MASPEIFTLTTAPGAWEDLRARLRAARLPDAPAGGGWSLGADVDYVRDLLAYWADGFDWPAAEAHLNELPHLRVTVGGHRLHVVHARGVATSARRRLPLLLCHGWPDSFWRYLSVLPLLTDPGAHGGDPADAFDVVVPDMPGYGYSDIPPGPAPDSRQVAGLFAELMAQLGYDRYAVAGGDIGSGVARFLALDDAEHVAAVHRMDAGVPSVAPEDLTPAEQDFLEAVRAWRDEEGGYAHVHQTKPQTAAVGLTDSPAGLAAWIVEKLRAWSDCDGDLERVFTRDQILTNLTIYWLTGTIGSSMRMYAASRSIPADQQLRRVQVPSGFTLYPGDITHPPRSWLARFADVASVSEATRGGHFAPVEVPEDYVRELRIFFRAYR